MASKMRHFWEKKSQTSDEDTTDTEKRGEKGKDDEGRSPTNSDLFMAPPGSALVMGGKGNGKAFERVDDLVTMEGWSVRSGEEGDSEFVSPSPLPRERTQSSQPSWEGRSDAILTEGIGDLSTVPPRSGVRFDGWAMSGSQAVSSPSTSPLRKRSSVAPLPARAPSSIDDLDLSRSSSTIEPSTIRTGSMDFEYTSVETPTQSSDKGTPGGNNLLNMSFATNIPEDDEFLIPTFVIDKAGLDLTELKLGLESSKERVRLTMQRFEAMRAQLQEIPSN
mmetsp:Transcript_8490/g.17220  ORF Transcript_8490/g.17220 Transcript_8490/m.17220 type:complete len:277 (-) Transcript_8490:1428-2258(-)